MLQRECEDEKDWAAHVNGVSSVYKIAKYHGNSNNVDTNKLMSVWFNALPVRGDYEETNIVYSRLIEFVQKYYNIFVLCFTFYLIIFTLFQHFIIIIIY
jgi:hypothetical protein